MKIFLLLIAAVIFLAVINGDNPCEHFKNADYHNAAYNSCMINHLKGL